jgi:transposase
MKPMSVPIRAFMPHGPKAANRHHASVTLFGALNAMTEVVLHQTSSSCKLEDFLSFLQLVANHYKDQMIVMVIDNARIHRSQFIQDFIAKNGRIVLFYLPPYSPHLPLSGYGNG